MRKAKNLYVGGEGATPFQNTIQSFGGGGIRPLAIEAFGEVNDETLTLLKDCAEIVARNPDVVKISPTTDYQHGTNNVYHILLRQFRKHLDVWLLD